MDSTDTSCSCPGADIFDVQLVATMLANDVTRIYTYNRPDFERFGEVKILTP
jgi:predicted nucleic acid-binding protein